MSMSLIIFISVMVFLAILLSMWCALNEPPNIAFVVAFVMAVMTFIFLDVGLYNDYKTLEIEYGEMKERKPTCMQYQSYTPSCLQEYNKWLKDSIYLANKLDSLYKYEKAKMDSLMGKK